jgi:hypothetical protein
VRSRVSECAEKACEGRFPPKQSKSGLAGDTVAQQR